MFKVWEDGKPRVVSAADMAKDCQSINSLSGFERVDHDGLSVVGAVVESVVIVDDRRQW
jgi:hypothetical protein